VRLAVSLAVVAGLVIKLSPGEIARTVRDADPWLLLAALLLMLVAQVLVLLKWSMLLRARGVRPSAGLVVRSYAIGNLLSNVLPTAVGGDVYRVYRVQREANARAADVTMTVLFERATGYGAMTCFGALGAAFYYGEAWIGIVALAGGAVVAALLALALTRMPFPAIPQDHVLRNLLAHRRELIAVYQMAVCSLAIQAIYITTIALAGRAFGLHVSWWYWCFSTWVIAVALLLPVTLGGLGLRESSYSAFVKHAGGTAAQGASVGFALGALLVCANLLLLAVSELAMRLGYVRYAPPDEALPAAARART